MSPFRQLLTDPLGAKGSRTGFEFQVRKSAQVLFKLQVGDAAGNTRDFVFPLLFRTEPAQPPGNIAASDPNYETSPTVLSVVPGGGATVTVGEDIIVNFSEAISLNIEKGGGVLATGSASGALETTVDLSPDQLSARLKLSAAMPGEEITLTFTASITDLIGNGLIPHTEVFRTAPTLKKDFTISGDVSAVADAGARSVVLERFGTESGKLSVFRQGTDLQAASPVGTLSLRRFRARLP